MTKLTSRSVAFIACAMALGLGNLNTQADTGDTVSRVTTFTNRTTKMTAFIEIDAEESTPAGRGSVNFGLWTDGLSVSTVHASGSLWEVGRAARQAVSIGAEVVEISAHGFVHSDHPNNIIYLGPVTLDIRVERKAGIIRVVISTPKGPIKLTGHLTDML